MARRKPANLVSFGVPPWSGGSPPRSRRPAVSARDCVRQNPEAIPGPTTTQAQSMYIVAVVEEQFCRCTYRARVPWSGGG